MARASARTVSSVDERMLEAVLAIADRTRFEIMMLLGRGGRTCVGDIAAQFKISRPAISHHLKVLRTSGLVKAEKVGQEVYYSLDRAAVVRVLRTIADAIEGCCPGGNCS